MGGMFKKKILVSVIGGHKCDERAADLAREIGGMIASSGAVLVCGGSSGIMEAACLGAKYAGGLTVGILPGEDKNEANDFVDIVITTGMGYSRNTIVAGTADIVIALPGEYGTLSEIGFALNAKKPVYGFGAWDIKGVVKLDSTEELRPVLEKYVDG
ncbi:MAG: TIGR00725 family protein [Candidatus Omnitrophota bacterium]